MHIQERQFGADIEPVYDRSTYILQHYAYTILDDTKGDKVVYRGTAPDLKEAVAAAERYISKLVAQTEAKPSGRKAA